MPSLMHVAHAQLWRYMGKNNGLLLFLEILVLVMMFFYAVSEIGESVGWLLAPGCRVLSR